MTEDIEATEGESAGLRSQMWKHEDIVEWLTELGIIDERSTQAEVIAAFAAKRNEYRRTDRYRALVDNHAAERAAAKEAKAAERAAAKEAKAAERAAAKEAKAAERAAAKEAEASESEAPKKASPKKASAKKAAVNPTTGGEDPFA